MFVSSIAGPKNLLAANRVGPVCSDTRTSAKSSAWAPFPSELCVGRGIEGRCAFAMQGAEEGGER
jgi:hypothetical protein